MKLNDYDFDLPEKLIAQSPLFKRDSSKLLVLNDDNSIVHEEFSNILNYLTPNDVIVRNNTRVIPARLFGLKKLTGAKIEVLMLKEIKSNIWQCMVKPAKRIKLNDIVEFGSSLLTMTCVSVEDEGIRHFELKYEGILIEILEKLGTMPLPPYIKESLENQERYQTIYSKNSGSAAAPTAGLHFTDDLLEKIFQKGIEVIDITLHVGLGTFKTVSVEDVKNHSMHSEFYEINQESADKLNNALKNNRRIIAIGTTTVRTLESNYAKYNQFKAESSETQIFIYPGYKFNVVDALITNFHLPKSTLMMLVSAMKSRETILKTYDEAIKNNYRFFSFGDSMFINCEKK